MLAPLLERLAQGPLVADGAMGTLLYGRGIPFSESFDELNLSRPALIESVHRDYLAAGAEMIETNTFGTNAVRLAPHGLEQEVGMIARQGVKVARAAREIVGINAFVAGSIGPLGKPLEPFGHIAAAQAEAHFRAVAEGLLEGGCDAFILETFQDLNEILAALRSVRRVTLDLPVIAQMTFGTDGKTLYGHTPTLAVQMLKQAGAAVVGVNCGVGPQPTLEVLEEMVRAAEGTPVSAMPNAGLPQMVEGRYLYLSSPEYFADFAARAVDLGVRIVGGCCGTTPAHVKAMRDRLALHLPAERLSPGAEVRVLEAAPAPVAVPEVVAEPALLRMLREKFVVSVEIDPPRGINTTKVMEAARLMAQRGVDCVNIADSPLARIRMSAMALAYQIHLHFPRLELILHFTTRDRNLMGLQSDLLGAHALGIRNILCLTGDPPSLGDYPNATAVFDTDAPGLMRIVHGMNHGTDLAGTSIGAATGFAVGCGVNPTAPDLDQEFEYVRRKLDAGPQFVMTQPVYELDCWKRFVERLSGLTEIPILVGILPLQSFRHAEFLHNEVPGILVPDWIRARMHQAGNEGQKIGVELARELLAACKGMANGVYLMPSFGRYENCLDVLTDAR
ncbi:MAG: bifunctional homocysteine S-methyltransferase/methylenetetrahydrofolate reductase [Candidatus Eisenbacteria bacterium]|uniref:Bifunctional homocysteine S-methyltransferase/methylenetetrahydrofolate reductase n=1 Tax=Eiseniibacteriota bacterium TaxID=2212470 RepID=A0A538UA04_UNCEI|nr:MAG: bifunctional homocysteine S-methyltransferase/methylenetetrahydrofolate reductase [Candidatus Eisenbacteria bacterium]